MKRSRQTHEARARGRDSWNAALARALRAGVRRHRRLRDRFVLKPTPRALHALRIETRRQLALVSLAAKLAGGGEKEPRRLLKRCLRATSKLRDSDVLLVLVDELCTQYPELGDFQHYLQQRRKRARQRARRHLEEGARKLSRRVDALSADVVSDNRPDRAGHTLVEALRRSDLKMRRLAFAARRDKAEVHHARAAVKQLRYMVEGLGESQPDVSTWLAALQGAQRAMGEIHDLDVLRSRLNKYASSRPDERRRLQRVKAAVASRQTRLHRRMTATPPRLPLGVARALTSGRRIFSK